jgi:DNA-binding NtrC family response regulator
MYRLTHPFFRVVYGELLPERRLILGAQINKENDRRYRVLIVDDEPELLSVMTEYLMRAGFEVMSVENAAQGLAKVSTFRPHLVISDICLPKTSGVELAVAVREVHPTVGLVFITGNTQYATGLEGKNLGLYELLEKPFGLKDFLACCHRACARSEEKGNRNV